MLRFFVLTAGLVGMWTLATVVTAPMDRMAFVGEAQAADFNGRIRRIRIKRPRNGNSFAQIQAETYGASADPASISLNLCSDKECSTQYVGFAIDVTGRTASYETGLFAYQGATPPLGSYELRTESVSADGEVFATQFWKVLADGYDITVTPSGESSGPISAVELTADACGNGSAALEVASFTEELGLRGVHLTAKGLFSDANPEGATDAKRAVTQSDYIDQVEFADSIPLPTVENPLFMQITALDAFGRVMATSYGWLVSPNEYQAVNNGLPTTGLKIGELWFDTYDER